MKMSLASQIFIDAEELRASLVEEKSSNVDSWVGRQKIQDLYQRLLLMDLEFALDKKVETDLWNVAFKHVIDGCQAKLKEKNPQKRAESQASLSLFLEAATGFYFQLMQDVCSAFKLDLPFRRKSARFGILNEPSPVAFDIKKPKKSSCFYLLQHILVHLGDIARYKKDMKQAEIFYTHAAQLIPTNGQPFNQLALLDMHRGDKLATVYHYVRSLAVKHPFSAASTNLNKFLERMSKEPPPSAYQKCTEENFLRTFSTFIALLHLRENLSKAKECFSSLTAMICTNGILSKLSLSSLHHLVVIAVFTLHRAQEIDSPKQSKQEEEEEDEEREEEEEDNHELVGEELEVYELTLGFLITVASDMILETIACDSSQVSEKNLQVIKIILAFISQSRKTFGGSWVKERAQFWPHLASLMNSLQSKPEVNQLTAAQISKLKNFPLKDETSLQGFLPLSRYFVKYDFVTWRKRLTESDGSEGIDQVVDASVVRCVHVLLLGRRISQSLRNLRLLSLEETKSGKMNFHSGIQVTDDHRFSDKIPASSSPSLAAASTLPSAFKPSEFRPPQTAPPRNPNLGPRFNRLNRQNVALQSFMANLAAETESTSEEKRQPSPNANSVTEDSTASSQSSAKVSFVPPPRMANLHVERVSQQQQQSQPALYDPAKGRRTSPVSTAKVPEDTRGKKNNQLYQVKKEDEENAEEFPSLQSTTKTSKLSATGSSFFSSSSSNSSASLSSSLSATVNKNPNYSLFNQNLPSWTPASKDGFSSSSPVFGLQDAQPNFAVPPPLIPPNHTQRHPLPQGASPFPYPAHPNAAAAAHFPSPASSLGSAFAPRQPNLPQHDLQQRPNPQHQNSQSGSNNPGGERPAIGNVFGDGGRQQPNVGEGEGTGAPLPSGAALPPSLPSNAFPGLMGPNSRPYGSYSMPGRPYPGQWMPGLQRNPQQPPQQPEYPVGFPGSESSDSSMRPGGEANNAREIDQTMLQQRNNQLQQQLQQRLHHERLHQERMEQERMLQERQQMMLSQSVTSQGGMSSTNSSIARPEPTANFGLGFSGLGFNQGFGSGETSMGSFSGNSALEKLIQDQRRRNQDSEN